MPSLRLRPVPAVFAAFALLVALALPALARAGEAPEVTTADGLKYQDLVVGTGALAKDDKMVAVHYTGRLEDGTVFDTSLNHQRPFMFRLGEGKVIAGWDEGIRGMRVGGKRRLTIPPALAYGDAGVPGVIPPGATLVFQVELMGVN